MPKNRILLVDDEPDIVETAAFMLQLHDYSVTTASCGVEGIQKAEEERPDLILLDIMMPDMDGYDVCMKLNENEGTKHIPIVVLTAKGESEAAMKCRDLGADDYVVKPFDLSTLLSKLERFLDK